MASSHRGRLGPDALGFTLLLATVLLSLSFVHDRPLLMPDTVTYVEGARALASGRGYIQNGSPITVRPPGYSLALVPLCVAGLDTIIAFKLLNVVFAALALVCFVGALGRSAGLHLATGAAATCGASFPWIYYTHAVLAESLFSLCLALFLLSATAWLDSGRKWLWWAMLFASMALPMIRFAGVAVLPAFAWVLFVRDDVTASRRLWRRLASVGATVALASLPLAAYVLRNYLLTRQATGYDLGASAEYALTVGQIGITDNTLLSRIWVNARGYLHVLLVPDQAGITAVSRLPWLATAACAGFWALAVVGALSGARKKAGRLHLAFVLPYGCILMLNTWYDIRYLLPVLPLLFLYFAVGFGWAAHSAATAAFSQIGVRAPGVASPAWLAGALLAVIFMGNAAFTSASGKGKRLRSRQYEGPAQRVYEAALFMRERPELGAVLVGGGPGFVPAWSGRPVVSVLAFLDKTGRLIIDRPPQNVAFILLDESEFVPYRKEYLEPLVGANEQAVGLAFRSGDTLVYKSLRENPRWTPEHH